VIASLFVETRTRWRKGEPGTREGVIAVLDALRDGIGAEALGLFDDDRGDLNPSPHTPQLNLWEAFGGLPCVGNDWGTWYAGLKRAGQVEAVCACGAGHRVYGFLIHDRWALLLVAPAVLAVGGLAAISSGVKTLAERLPPAKKPDPNPVPVPESDDLHGDLHDPRPAAIPPPVWWVRPTRH
jgi:hypothetical protein